MDWFKWKMPRWQYAESLTNYGKRLSWDKGGLKN